MCMGCYEGYFDGRQVPEVTPEMRDAVTMILAYEDMHPGGGDLHIIIHDWNLEDGHLRFCARETNDLQALHILTRLALFDLDRRFEVMRLVEQG